MQGEAPETSLETPVIVANNSAEEELVQLVTKVCHAINAREWNHPAFLFLSDKILSVHENVGGETVTSRQDHIDAHRRIAERDPGYSLEISRITAHINDNQTTADIWMDLIVKGIGEGGRFQKESVSVLRARKVQDCWTCWKQYGLRGVSS